MIVTDGMNTALGNTEVEDQVCCRLEGSVCGWRREKKALGMEAQGRSDLEVDRQKSRSP